VGLADESLTAYIYSMTEHTPPRAVMPADLAARAVAALRSAPAPTDGARRRVALVLAHDASSAPRREFTMAVRGAISAAGLRGVRVTARLLRGAAESRVEVESHPMALRVQGRDRDLLGFLGIARYLSTLQVAALVFPGRHLTAAWRRLRLLATASGGGFVRLEHYVGAERSRIRVYSLTHAGYELAESVTRLATNYSTDPVRPQFLEHLVWLNELFVGLAVASGGPVSPGRLPFRWRCDTDHPLAFRTRGPDGAPAVGHVAPDAVVDFPAARRRVLVEAERGTHTIVPLSPSKTGATMAKLDRYTSFFADVIGARRQTAYAEHFPDGFAPELLFLVQTETRRDRVCQAVDARLRKDSNPPGFAVQVLTLEQAKERYAPLVRAVGAAQEAAVARETPRPEEVAFTMAEVSAMRTAFNALLRRAKAAQAAGLGGLAPAEVEAVGGTRAVLARFDAAGQS
jgi:hypothetical protein